MYFTNIYLYARRINEPYCVHMDFFFETCKSPLALIISYSIKNGCFIPFIMKTECTKRISIYTFGKCVREVTVYAIIQASFMRNSICMLHFWRVLLLITNFFPLTDNILVINIVTCYLTSLFWFIFVYVYCSMFVVLSSAHSIFLFFFIFNGHCIRLISK